MCVFANSKMGFLGFAFSTITCFSALSEPWLAFSTVTCFSTRSEPCWPLWRRINILVWREKHSSLLLPGIAVYTLKSYDLFGMSLKNRFHYDLSRKEFVSFKVTTFCLVNDFMLEYRINLTVCWFFRPFSWYWEATGRWRSHSAFVALSTGKTNGHN